MTAAARPVTHAGRVHVPWHRSDPRAVEASLLPETDLGLAERFALWCGDTWRYRPGIGWMRYDGRRWVWDEHGHDVRAAMQQVVRAVTELEAATLPAVAGDGRRRSARDQRRAWGRACETPRRIDAALDCAVALPGCAAEHEAWDSDPYALNTLTGLVDLRTGLLAPHDPAHLCTGLVNAPYYPDARHRALDAVLTHLTAGDGAVRTFLQRWFGYSLTGSMTAEVFLFLSGAAESGKSTLFSAFTAMLGSYAETAAPETFAQRQATSGPTPELARLAGKRFVYVPEAGGIRLDVARVKSVVGGDPVVARLLHRNPVTFRPVCKLAFTANELAVIPDDDPGLRRRLLPLRVATPVTRRDTSIKDALDHTVEGRAALLAFAAAGARDWLREGADLPALQPPQHARDELASYLAEMDPLREWFDDRVKTDPDAATHTAVLHADYAEWCRRHGIRHVLGVRAFAARLTQRGHTVAPNRRDGSRRTGIALRPAP